MSSVAFMTYKDPPYVLENDDLLINQLTKLGINTVVHLSWDKKNVNWNQFDCLVFRSCWDFCYRIDEFSQWLELLEKNKVKTFNPLPIVRWNLNKKYLLELEKKGTNIIPTTFINKDTSFNLRNFYNEKNFNELIIKPAIGGSGFEVLKVTKNDLDEAQMKVDKLLENTDILIQPLMSEIKNGEMSMIFIDNAYSHTVLKTPPANEYRTNYDYGVTESVIHPDGAILEDAQKIINLVQAQLLYARVDGIMAGGKFTLMELELIDPYLYLDLHPESASKLARALKRFISM